MDVMNWFQTYIPVAHRIVNDWYVATVKLLERDGEGIVFHFAIAG